MDTRPGPSCKWLPKIHCLQGPVDPIYTGSQKHRALPPRFLKSDALACGKSPGGPSRPLVDKQTPSAAPTRVLRPATAAPRPQLSRLLSGKAKTLGHLQHSSLQRPLGLLRRGRYVTQEVVPPQRGDGLETETPAQFRWLRLADLSPRAQPLPHPLTRGPGQPCWAPSTCTDRTRDRAALGAPAAGCACTRPHAVCTSTAGGWALGRGPGREQPRGLAHRAGQLRFTGGAQAPGSLPSLPSCTLERLWKGS